ncbi:hypothetical protein Dimus_008117, partial [Dionaea muscipula]
MVSYACTNTTIGRPRIFLHGGRPLHGRGCSYSPDCCKDAYPERRWPDLRFSLLGYLRVRWWPYLRCSLLGSLRERRWSHLHCSLPTGAVGRRRSSLLAEDHCSSLLHCSPTSAVASSSSANNSSNSPALASR